MERCKCNLAWRGVTTMRVSSTSSPRRQPVRTSLSIPKWDPLHQSPSSLLYSPGELINQLISTIKKKEETRSQGRDHTIIVWSERYIVVLCCVVSHFAISRSQQRHKRVMDGIASDLSKSGSGGSDRSSEDRDRDGGIFEYFGWVYHLGVNSLGHEYCHLRFLFIRGKYVAMYKRDPHEYPVVCFFSFFYYLLPFSPYLEFGIFCA